MVIPDVPLPPLLRKWQQTWLWQVLGLPLVVGFGSAMLVSGCLKDGIQNITTVCVWGALNSTLVSFLTVVFSGHPPGSSDFKSDGTPTAAPVLKQLDDNVLLVKEKATDPTSSISLADARFAEDSVKRAAAAVLVNAGMVKTALDGEVKRP